MTPADRARIAREWGIPEAEIPEPTVCPPSTWAADLIGWRDLRQMQFRLMVRRNKFARLAEREGRA
jgi:hypothetical protein